MKLRSLLFPLALAGAACGNSIAPEDEATADGTPGADGGLFTDAGDVSPEQPVVLEVDATSNTAWSYLDLERARLVTPEDPAHSAAWDLGFRRFAIALNGGVSGSGGVEAAVLESEFDAVMEAPDDGYITDRADGADEDEEPELVLSTGDTGWYDYDVASHVLTPRKRVYVIRTVERNLFKLEVQSYYNDAGSSGYPRVRFSLLRLDAGGSSQDGADGSEVDASVPVEDAGIDTGDPGESDAGSTGDAGSGDSDAGVPDFRTLTVDASASGTWLHVSVADGVLALADGSSSSAWDVAFQRTMIRTNGGTSGPGMGGARLLEGDFASTHDSPYEDGFTADALLPIPGPPGSGEFSGNAVLSNWYDYDVTTHTVSPKAQAYVLRTASGEYAKLRITAYAGGVFTIDLGAL